jgi:small-conductance mechanosensitive channel
LNPYLEKGFLTFLALTIIFLIFKLVLEGILVKGIKGYKTRYSFKKAISVIYLLIFLLLLATLWIENPQSLLLAMGLIGAGIAISLQDFFKNFVGGILILVSGIYRVGDRIEIASKYGDVIEIGVFFTTLMEMKEWVAGDQATGRITIIPNGYVLGGQLNNYTKDHNFIWDEIMVPLTYDSNWKAAQELFIGIVEAETKSAIENAEQGMAKLKDRYYMSQKRLIHPRIFLKMTDNWIELYIRYITPVEERRTTHDILNRKILEGIQKVKDIKIASATFDIVGFPEVKITRNNKE